MKTKNSTKLRSIFSAFHKLTAAAKPDISIRLVDFAFKWVEKAEIIMMLSNRFRKVNVRHLNVLVLPIPVNLLLKASQQFAKKIIIIPTLKTLETKK